MWIEGKDGEIERPPVLDMIEAFFCVDPPDRPGQLADRYAWLFRQQSEDPDERRRIAYCLGATPKIMDCFLGWDEASQTIITNGMRAAFKAAALHDPPLSMKTVAIGATSCSVAFVSDTETLTVMIAKPVVKAKLRR